MALALGTITEGLGPSTAGPYNTAIDAVPHNNGGADFLLVLIYTLTDGTMTVSNAQYNGVALTPLPSPGPQSNNTLNPGGCVFAGTLVSPASGTNDITADIVPSGTNTDSYVVLGVPITGVDTSDPVGVVFAEPSAASASTTVSQTNTTESDNSFHFLGWSMRDGVNPVPITPGSGMTEDVEVVSNANSISGMTAWLGHKLVVTAGSDTVAATSSSSERESGISFEIKEDTGAPAGRIMSSLAGSGGLAYHGGIAGTGGGLAG